MKNLRLKQPNGWFAADRSFQKALTLLSDGAFKLFALLCLEAERPSGRLAFHQAELAQKLGKSRRSIGAYLNELQEKGTCRITSGKNQYDYNIFQFEDHYWPYETDPDENEQPSQEETDYLKTIETFYSSRLCVRFSLSEADQNLARKWFHRSIDLVSIEQAILLGCGRKYVSWLNGQYREPIGSLYYFNPILKEVLSQKISKDYCRFNRFQVNRLEKRWLKSKNGNPESGCENFAQPNPPKERRDEMMLTT
jgi:biotin operon repressor